VAGQLAIWQSTLVRYAVRMANMARALSAAALLVIGLSPAAQSPSTLPLVRPNDLRYLGAFTIPNPNWNGQQAWHYGGYAMGMGADAQSLYIGGHAWYHRLGKISIPAIDGVAVEQIAPVEIPNRQAIDPDEMSSATLGGSLLFNGRLIASTYIYYDGDGDAEASHFVAKPDLTGWSGPYRVGELNPGFVGGYMGLIPAEWQALLGGPALTGQCCIGIISRSSFGPSVSVFNPDELGVKTPVPAKMLLGYPQGHEELGRHSETGALFNASVNMGGIAFVPRTRSLLFIGRRGGGPVCYGPGTSDATLAGKPDGAGNTWCMDPTDHSKGFHGYPYQHFVWAYDANDLLKVKNGDKKPWDLRPYETWTLAGANDKGTARMRSVTFDPMTRRIYMTEEYADEPRVHVWQVTEH
jgi:hypothetical protein